MTGISNSMTRIITEHPIASTAIGAGLGAVTSAALCAPELAKAITIKTAHLTLNVLSQAGFAISMPVASFVGSGALLGFLCGSRDPVVKNAAKIAAISTLLSVASGALMGAERLFLPLESVTTRQQVVFGATLGGAMPIAMSVGITVIFGGAIGVLKCIGKYAGPSNPTT